MTDEFDVVGFQTVVERHWDYHRPCRHRLWSSGSVGDAMQLEVAPIFQEVLGGDQDGLRVWTAYSMRLSDLFSEPGIEVTEFGFRTYCVECNPTPMFGVRGKYKGHPFVMMIYLEPIPQSKTVEVIDTLGDEVRAIKERQP